MSIPEWPMGFDSCEDIPAGGAILVHQTSLHPFTPMRLIVPRAVMGAFGQITVRVDGVYAPEIVWVTDGPSPIYGRPTWPEGTPFVDWPEGSHFMVAAKCLEAPFRFRVALIGSLREPE